MSTLVVRNSLAVTFALVFACFESTAETIWNNWHVESPEELGQLSNHTITLVKKTGPREVWIASTEGIYFFDGQNIAKKHVPWISQSNAPVKRVLTFATAQNGTTYLFTKEDGIYKMPSKGSQFDRFSGHENRQEIKRIKAVTASRIRNSAIFIADERVFSLQLDSSAIQEIITNTDASYGVPLGLLSSNDNHIFVVYGEFIVRLAWQRDRFVAQRSFPCKLQVQSVATTTQANNNSFYLTDNLGKLHRIRLTDHSCTEEQVPDALRSLLIGSRVNAVKFLSKMRALAVSTDKGLLIFRQDSAQRISTNNSPLRSNEILTVDESSEESILIGSFRGIMHANLRPYISINRLHLEQKPTVTAIASSQAFGVFVATTKGLYRQVRHREGVSFSPFELQGSHSNLSALEITSLGAWIGFQDGSLMFCDLQRNIEACDFGKTRQVSDFPVTSITKLDVEGARAMVTTLEGQAYRTNAFGDQTNVQILLDTDDPVSRLSATETTLKHAWLLDLNQTRTIPISGIRSQYSPPAPKNHLAQLEKPWAMVSAGRYIYFATPGGRVSLFSEDAVISEKNPTPVWTNSLGETVFSIEIDSLHRPWVGTNSGLWMRDDNGVFSLEIGTRGSDAIAVDYGASYSDATGHLYFGGTGGLIYVNKPNQYPLERFGSLMITKIRINGGRVISEENFEEDDWRLTIESGNKDFSIEYGLTELFSTRMSGFEHKLEGFDNDWQNSGSVNVATYQNLPPGNYTFRARGADSAGVWSNNEISLPISVLPPVWRTWWALAGYLLLAFAFFKYLKTWNDRNVAQRERLRLAEEGSAAFARLEDDYQAQREANELLLLRRTPSAHQLLDALETAITAALENYEENTAKSIANRFSTLRSLQTLTDRTTTIERTNVYALTNEITASLAQSNETAARAIITNDVSDKPVPMEQALYLCLVIQEALEFAIMGRHYDEFIDPMIYIAMAAPARDDRGETQYHLRIEDSGLKNDGDSALERLMPLTQHLIEAGGGEISDVYDAGNTLSISLRFVSNGTAME